MLVDSHCHLDCLKAPEQALTLARTSGVGYFLTIGLSPEDIEQRLSFVTQHHDVVMSVGLHPCHVDTCLQDSKALYEVFLAASVHQKVVAIGETGLDLMEGSPPLEKQIDYFVMQMRLGLCIDVPVIIHMRGPGSEALLDDIFARFQQEHGALPKHVFHCFTGTAAFAQRAVARGGLISFSGIVTFPKAQEVQDAARVVSLEGMLLETDAPYLAPVPYRGKENQPAYMVETAHHLAALKKVSFEEIAHHTTENFFRLFTKAHRL